MHRGRRYKIESMDSPPLLSSTVSFYRYNCSNLGAYAKPTTLTYSTQALSISTITIVKQLGRVDIQSKPAVAVADHTRTNQTEEESQSSFEDAESGSLFTPPLNQGSFAGHGVVTVKRTVHGYKKLSLVNRIEVSYSKMCFTYQSTLCYSKNNYSTIHSCQGLKSVYLLWNTIQTHVGWILKPRF
jgi:hypothetical protein